MLTYKKLCNCVQPSLDGVSDHFKRIAAFRLCNIYELWLDVYKSNHSATPDTKLRSFQVKFYQRAIVTNIALHCFGIADSDKCSFCNTERETLLHLFCTCSSLVLFWENVLSWIETKLKLLLDLQPFNLLFGVEKDHDYHLIINCLLLHARFLIYKCKI